MDGYATDLLAGLKTSLEEESKTIAIRIAELTSQDPFSDPERLNDNASSDSDASEESNHDRVYAQISELKEQLLSVHEALTHIANGTYGFCTHCKKMIDTDRLAIIPSATLCLDCEKKKVRK